MDEVLNELNWVCEDFWTQVKEGAKSNYNTYWMWDWVDQERLSPEQISDWEAMSYDEMDKDLYISKWGENDYRFLMFFNAVMTNHPEGVEFRSLPLP